MKKESIFHCSSEFLKLLSFLFLYPETQVTAHSFGSQCWVFRVGFFHYYYYYFKGSVLKQRLVNGITLLDFYVPDS